MNDLFNFHQETEDYGLTYDLWKNFPVGRILGLKDRSAGYGVMLDPSSFDCAVDAAAATVLYGTGGIRGYIDTGCTITQTTMATGGPGGAVRLATTTTDNIEAWIQFGGATGSPFRISDAATEAADLIFECEFRISSVTDTNCGFFIGLMEEGCAAADSITDAGALADKDYFGFHRLEADGDKLDIVYKKNGQTAVSHKADWKTIAAATWYRVGFRYDAASKSITPWFGTGDRSTTVMAPDKDNKVIATDIASATDIFPDAEGMSPIIGIKNATNVAYTLDIRVLACAQRFIAL